MIKITVTNLHGKFRLNGAFLRTVARGAAESLGMKRGELAIIFVGSSYIKKLNRVFKKRDRPTDVLGFDVRPPGRRGVFGDIFISLDAAKKNAGRFGSYFGREVVLYIVHGMLHLAGYDDASPEGRVGMRKKETELLDGICRIRNLSKVST